jgi:hypothetical protein
LKDRRLIKQLNIGSWIGALKTVFGQVGQYISFVTMGLAAIAAYPVISSWLVSVGLSFPLLGYVLIMVGIILLICILEYIFGQPSTFSYWNEQWWEHDNPMRKEMDDLNEYIKIIEKKIDNLGRGNDLEK